jgi:hypothetical protein
LRGNTFLTEREDFMPKMPSKTAVDLKQYITEAIKEAREQGIAVPVEVEKRLTELDIEDFEKVAVTAVMNAIVRMFRELQVPRSVGVKAIAALHEELTSWSAEDAAKVASESQLKEFMDLVKN